jgi:hypothetical protein
MPWISSKEATRALERYVGYICGGVAPTNKVKIVYLKAKYRPQGTDSDEAVRAIVIGIDNKL